MALQEARAQQVAELQRLEQRQAAVELRMEALAAALEQRLAAAAQEQAAVLGGLQDFFNSTLSQVISSVADQFDAVQQALDEAISGRAQVHQVQKGDGCFVMRVRWADRAEGGGRTSCPVQAAWTWLRVMQ